MPDDLIRDRLDEIRRRTDASPAGPDFVAARVDVPQLVDALQAVLDACDVEDQGGWRKIHIGEVRRLIDTALNSRPETVVP